MDEKAEGAPRQGDPAFQSTLWSVVLKAGDSRLPDSHGALERLCRAYWMPLYTFARRRGCDPHDAQDLTQGFFAQLIEKRMIKRADPDRGRFRSFLLGAMKNYITDDARRKRAQKRGGGRAPLSIDAEEAEGRYLAVAGEGATPEEAYDRRWAQTVMARAVERLETEVDKGGRTGRFAALDPFLLGVPPGDSFAALAGRLGQREEAVKSAVHRMRRRFAGIVRAEVAETVADPTEVEVEIRFLFETIAR